ncbi:hypothetical protein FB566_4017 [Stackebrandtia endophytica]|uniref:Uncharacterized protein n=1 Tax=Stackebrandtia endophytica TaxID=1496996 RepID=A0A543B0R5_9ACTN|nr:DUF5682 family protein [Stackebrandtia endophytica]TQL78431.1 hypothetical protein FB566_4017 [Stackebrandtia endophytica]
MTADRFAGLRQQLDDAAANFAGSHQALADVLTGMVDDVERAMREPLEVFPVCHHSPASAVAMARRLRQKAPRVIYLELCEDLRPLLKELRNCQLPVALQAFAGSPKGFGEGTGPMSVVAPLTEASAEYQAIVYALDNPDVELVFVDRSTDHVFQWGSREEPKPEPEPETTETAPDSEEAALHGDSVGVEIGDMRPRFAELEEFLLHHGKVRHWSEFWDQFVEQPLVGADYDTYRQVMTLIGSLFRRLTPPDSRSLVVDEDRERYMWTRIREHLASSGADPATCMYVCGAFHASSRVDEFGLDAPETDFVISDRSETVWQYGLIPSSHSSIEAQFGLAPGSVSIAAETWSKALKRNRVKPFTLGAKSSVVSAPRLDAEAEADDQLSAFLSAPSEATGLDEDELLRWCVDIVRLARKNGYLASTADAIAVFETSILLAGMRNRSRPTPYDFADAAVTCIEKESVPGRRDVRRLCEILLGGDRIGKVGYDSLPPLAQDVFDRLKPLGIEASKRNTQRILIDLTTEPHLRSASRLLWILRGLLGSVVQPITGVCTLEEQSTQESWDVSLGRYQRGLIELGYQGVTVEQVLEQRLRRKVRTDDATAARALQAVEDAIVYLESPQLVTDLGDRAVELLAAERNVDDAPEVLRRVRRLLSYYRTRGTDLPQWLESFVRVGYAHYCTLLPSAFTAEDVGIRQVGAMVGFLVSMEGLAVSLGCDRTQLELAVKQSHPEIPGKVALRWAVQYQLGALSLAELRKRCADLLDNPLAVGSFPQYLSGFVQTLDSIPRLTSFVVELLSTAFGRLPDSVLVPWLPNLITTLKKQAPDMVPLLVREAGRTFPAGLDAIDTWTPPWLAAPAPAVMSGVEGVAGGVVAELLDEHRTAVDAHAALIGATGDWAVLARPPAGAAEVAGLLADHDAAAHAHAALVV